MIEIKSYNELQRWRSYFKSAVQGLLSCGHAPDGPGGAPETAHAIANAMLVEDREAKARYKDFVSKNPKGKPEP